jgi:hypothetical protein
MERTFVTLGKALAAAGSSMRSVMQLTTYLTSPALIEPYFEARTALYPPAVRGRLFAERAHRCSGARTAIPADRGPSRCGGELGATLKSGLCRAGIFAELGERASTLVAGADGLTRLS